MIDTPIKSLKDLDRFRTAPNIEFSTRRKILNELLQLIQEADWLTIGIMASSTKLALGHLREIESFFNWPKMIVASNPDKEGPVFLKANQKTNNVYIRIEYGLGEGILLSCQKESEHDSTQTFGPLPLNLFENGN